MTATFMTPTTYAMGPNPFAVTVADVNGDGTPDLVVADFTGGVSVRLGLGGHGGEFGAATTYAAGAGPFSVATADVNGDGRLDLVVADDNGGVAVLLGNGSGGFGAPTTFAAGPFPASVTTADLNRDGKLDLIVADTTGGVAVLLGNGSGGFGPATTFAAGPNPAGAMAADVNGDGKLDLVVADSSGGVAVLLGNGVGGFSIAKTYAAGPNPAGLTVADVNGDGKLDLVVADSSGGVAVLLGTGTGTFGAATTYAAGPSPVSVTTADVNGDGKLDLVVADNGGGVSVLLGTGAGAFGVATTYAAGSGPETVTTADLNGDGKPDIVVDEQDGVAVLLNATVNPNPNPPTVTGIAATPSRGGVLRAGQTVAFTVTTSAATEVLGAPMLTLSDGRTASYTGGAGTTALTFLYTVTAGDTASSLAVTGLSLNGATISPQATFVTTSYAAGPNPYGVTTADLNRDGKLDLVVADYGGGVSVLLGNGSGGFGTAVSYAAGPTPVAVATADVNRDGILDLVVADSGGGVSVLLGKPSGQFGTATTFAAGASPFSVTTADLKRNGILDLVVADGGGGVVVLLGDGNGGFGAATTYAPGSSGNSVVVADVNGDGKPDLVVGGYNGVLVLPGDGSGGFGTAATYGAGLSAGVITAVDVNGDGKLDLVLGSGGTVNVLLSDGSGGFGAAAGYTVGGSVNGLSTADVNGDGILDIVVANITGVSLLPGLGNGVFGAPSTYDAGPEPVAVATADLNGDGRPDLVFADYAGGVSVLLNSSGATGSFDPSGTAAAPGANTGLAIDAVPPTVVSVTASPGTATLGAGGVATLTLLFSNVVTVDGHPLLMLNDGGTARYASGSGTNSLVFSYTVAGGQHTADLAVLAVNLDGGTIMDAANNTANLAGAAVNPAGTLAVNGGIGKISATGITTTANPGPLGVGQVITFSVTLDQPVTVANGTPSLTLSDGGTASYIGSTGPTNLTFSTTVAAGQNSADLRVTGIALNGGAVTASPFTDSTDYAAGSQPNSVVAADVNKDGLVDLVVADKQGGVDVLLGGGGPGGVGFGAPAVYAAGQDPVSVAVGDVNGDGIADLIVADYFSTVSVLLGDGQGGFGTATTYAVGYDPTSVTLADVNGDGVLDIVVSVVDYTANDQGDVVVLLGDGQGGFGRATVYDAGPVPVFATAVDVTGDGKADLVVADLTGGVSVLPGLGGAGGSRWFGSAISYAAGPGPEMVTAADLNGDGRPDLVVADGNGGVTVLLARSTGGFGAPATYLAGTTTQSVTVADVNGDGKPDIIVGTRQSSEVMLLLGDGAGGFGAASTISYVDAAAFTTADVNNDGTLDVVIADSNVTVLPVNPAAGGVLDTTTIATAPGADTGLVVDTTPPTISSVTVSPSTGALSYGQTATFTLTLTVAVTVAGGVPTLRLNDGGTATYTGGSGTASLNFSYTVKVGQITPDLAVVSSALNGAVITDLAGNVANLAGAIANPAGTLAVDSSPKATAITTAPATGPLGVGKVITFTVTLNQSVAVTGGTPSLTLSDGGTAAYTGAIGGASTKTLSFQTTVTSGQDTADLLVTGITLNGAAIGIPGTYGLGAATTYAATGVFQAVATADVNGDGILDIVALGEPVVAVLLGNGSGGFAAPVTYAAATSSIAVATADLNRDGRPDMLILNSTGGILAVRLNDGSGGFGAQTTYAAGPSAQGLAVADVNGDGKVDVIVADYSGGVTVLLGNGSGGFAPGTTYAAGPNPYGVAVADVNGDGKLDLLVADNNGSGAGFLSVLLGNGSGGFGSQTSYAAGSGADSITAADLNGDGRIDAVVTDYNGGVAVLLGNGSGGFGPATTYAVGTNPYSATVADINGDGKPDIVASAFQGGVSVLLGNGSGGFAAAVTYAAGTHPKWVVTGDVNGDAKPDIIVADYGSSAVDVLLNSSIAPATFDPSSIAAATGANTGLAIETVPPAVTALTASPATAAVGVNGVVTLTLTFSHPVLVTGVPTLMLNDGGAASYAGGSGTASLVFTYTVIAGQNTPDLTVTAINLNGGAIKDAVGAVANLAGALANPAGTLQVDTVAPVLNTVTASPSTAVLTFGQTDTLTLTFSKAVTVTGGVPTLTLNDGGTAVYAGGSGTTALSFVYTVGAGQVTPDLAVIGSALNGAVVTDLAGNPASLAGAAANPAGTLAVDGSPKVTGITTASAASPLGVGQVVTFTVALNQAVIVSGAPSLTLNDGGKAAYTGGTGTATLTFATTVAAGQNTPDLQVAGIALNGGAITNTQESFATATTYAAGAGPQSATAADVNGDGKLDLIVADASSGGVAVLLGDGAGGFGAPSTYAAGPQPETVIAADLNGDGRPDLVVADFGGSTVAVLPGLGGGLFGMATTFAAGPHPYSVVALDVNGDGKLDLVAADYGSSAVSVLLGDGSGGFGPATTYAAGPNPVSVAAVDVNGDGRLDLITAGYGGKVAVLLGNGSGGFGAPSLYDAGPGPISVATADLNSDGKQDIIVADYGGSTVAVLLGLAGGAFAAAVTYAASAHPYSVAAADVNGDGKPDLVVVDNGASTVAVLLGDGSGGFGAATTYAAGTSLLSATTADVNGDGRPDIIASDQSGGVSVLLNNPTPLDGSSVATAPGADTGLVVGNGEIDIAAGSTVTLNGSVAQGQVVRFLANTGTLGIGSAPGFAGTVCGAQPGDLIDFTGIGPGGVASVNLVAGNKLQLAGSSTTLASIQLDPAQSFAGEFFHFATDGTGGTQVTEDGTPCYCRGTRILTEKGEVAVEDLVIGDRLVTHFGPVRPIRWIGMRSYAGRFAAGNRDVLPVLIRAGALSDGVPARNLHVSPLHAMFLDGVLVPALALVNGRSIVQRERVDTVDYFHLELETHDVILAEGAASESFLDDDSRRMFHNWADHAALYPRAAPGPALYCAPWVEGGAILDAVRDRIAARAGMERERLCA